MNDQLLEVKTMLGQLRLSGAREKLEELLVGALKEELTALQFIHPDLTRFGGHLYTWSTFREEMFTDAEYEASVSC